MDGEKLKGLIREVIAGFEDGATTDTRALAKRAAEALADELDDAKAQPKATPTAQSADALDKAIAVLTQFVEAKNAAHKNAAQKTEAPRPDVPRIPARG